MRFDRFIQFAATASVIPNSNFDETKNYNASTQLSAVVDVVYLKSPTPTQIVGKYKDHPDVMYVEFTSTFIQ